MPPLAPPRPLQPTRSQVGSTTLLEGKQGGVNVWNTLSKYGILTSRGKEPNHTLFVTSLPSIIITTEKVVHCLIHIQALEKEERKGGVKKRGKEEGVEGKDEETEGGRRRRVRSSIYITHV